MGLAGFFVDIWREKDYNIYNWQGDVATMIRNLTESENDERLKHIEEEKAFLPNTLLIELPFYFVGMTSKEYEAELERFGQFLADGGRPYEYIPLNKRKKNFE